MGQRPVFQLGVDLLDDRVTAMGFLSVDQGQRAAEHRVVLVEREQLLLLSSALCRLGHRVGRGVEAFDAAHDQPRLDVLGFPRLVNAV